MNGLMVWKIAKIFMGVGALTFAILSSVAVWRLRGVLNWRRSLRSELKELSHEMETDDRNRRQALEIVLNTCEQVWRSSTPDLKVLTNLLDYIRSLAACFYPEVERPELQITIGRLLNAVRQSAGRLEHILCRPGFKRLQRIRIRHIRQSYEWYRRVTQNRIVRFLQKYQTLFKGLYRLNLAVFWEPFSLLAYFSNRLTVMVLSRCLLVDIYLFAGKMSLYAYGEKAQGGPAQGGIEDLEQTFEELDTFEYLETEPYDPRILEIRNRLAGFGNVFFSTPKAEDLKQAVTEAARVIAEKYFPDKAHPLEEASLGPLLKRSQAWLSSMCETENFPVIKKAHHIRLEHLYNLKALSESLPSGQIMFFAKKSWDMYRWMRWPLKIYRWIKKTSPVGITLNVGWIIARKSMISFVYRFVFDKSCKELEMVYRQSL